MQQVTKVFMVLILAAGLVQAAWASRDYERFYGSYEGEAIVESNGEQARRDLGVMIRKAKEGFQLNWTTTTVRADGSEKSKSYTIEFFPTDRANIYRSAMKANLFGGREPLDPMKGDPYVWAHINDDTLTVHALIINEVGGYEMQTYERTLVDQGLSLHFSRIHNGEPAGEINALLTRIGD